MLELINVSHLLVKPCLIIVNSTYDYNVKTELMSVEGNGKEANSNNDAVKDNVFKLLLVLPYAQIYRISINYHGLYELVKVE